jgi:hypothetical protein
MATDASSGSIRRHPALADDSGAAHGRVPQGSPRNLTQELAQLLAASIAQNQASRSIASGLPTNAELTSLASLVSAASGQRGFAPGFKDGLSALSYSKPRHGLSDHEPDMHGDDEPMPIPSTWREPTASDDQRWYRQQMGAAFLGLIAGLMIVVPCVLWLSGSLGPPKPSAPAEGRILASGETKIAEIKTVKVQLRPVDGSVESATQFVTGRSPVVRSISDRESRDQGSAVSESATRMAEARRVEEVLAQATRRVSEGDVTGARTILEAAEGGAQGPVTFALAETFDPNVLAAWGSRGVASDVERAKALYRKALDLGVARAHMRLEALE